jgi:predicted enzyme related to lactoylglutathione lyase
VSMHPIVHVDFPAIDPVEAGKFYADVFDWNVHTDPSFNYTMFQVEGGPGGGYVATGEGASDGTHGSRPGEVLVYIATDDIDMSLGQVVAHGGSVVVPKTEITHVGWFAVFTDPTGNRVGLYTPMNPQG